MARVVHHENHLAKEIRKSPRRKLLFFGVGILLLFGAVNYISLSAWHRELFSTRFDFLFLLAWLLYMFIALRMGQGKRTAILKRGLEGEERTEKLLSKLPDSYTILSDLTIHAGGKESQIDHIVVGPTGVFVIETKNLNGVITGNATNQELYQHKTGRAGGQYGKSFYNPVKQVATHVWRVALFLKEHRLQTWVYGVVFFSNQEAHVNVSAPAGFETPVFSYREGPQKLLDYIVHSKGNGLSEKRQKEIVQQIMNASYK